MTFPTQPSPYLPILYSGAEKPPGGAARQAERTTETRPDRSEQALRGTAKNTEFATPPTAVPSGALNGAIIQQFNANQTDALDVLRVTSQLIRDHAGEWATAQACLDALQSARHPVTGLGIEPNGITFNVAMASCLRLGLAEDAVRWFNDMLARRILPDAQCYTTVIQCCRNSGRSDLALGLLQHMIDHGPQRGVMPTIELVNLVLSACGKTGRMDDVAGLLDYLRDRGPALGLHPDIVTCNTAIWAYGMAGRPTDARRVFRQMQQAPASTAVTPDISTYNGLLFSCPSTEVSGLLGMATFQGLLRPSLGFDRARNRLNLHNLAVLAGRRGLSDRGNTVHPAMGQAIFHHLLQLGLINERTWFVIGAHSSDKLESTIAQCMREQGWTPCHPLVDGSQDIHDFGMLMNSDQGAGAGVPLNPQAASFQPTGAHS